MSLIDFDLQPGQEKQSFRMLLEVSFIRCTHVADSSSIIKDVQDMCLAGLANLAIFYFHFGDTTKQDARNLLSSIIFQLCSQSDEFSQAISSIYSSHGNGSREPSIDTLLDCLKTILALRGQAPLYIVVDALDECPNSSGVKTQRQDVLEILKELIDLKYPHLHLCVTSRPEIDIQRAFDRLNPYNVSLHNQAGQIKDLAEYVKSVVGSDPTMQNWPPGVKEMVISALTEKGGGMYVILVLTTPSIPFSCDDFRFRWAYCQLETLRQCPLRYISSTLEELPETLDETYERILRGIPKKMQKDAHRIFQWIMVSSKPLSVEAVAEVFAINFDEEMSGIPVFEPSWRDANAETAVLSACSTLIAIVDDRWHRKILQFSHFSVREYLASDRIANAEHVSCFHIHPKPAHALLAKSCLSVLLYPDYSIEKVDTKNFPLIMYAAEHWAEHARFQDISSFIGDGMDLLFEKDKPHFDTWVRVYDIDEDGCLPRGNTREECHTAPLYYAALCGIGDLVRRLLTAHPQDPDAAAGFYDAPLNAALAKGYLDIAQILLDHGAVGDIMGYLDQTGLYIASSRGYAGVVRSLIDRGANLNARCSDGNTNFDDFVWWTPLDAAIYNDHPDIALLLLEGGADPETRSSEDQTALGMASSRGQADVVKSLIYYGADLNAKSKYLLEVGYEAKEAPLFIAIESEHRDIVLLLLEGGADAETWNYLEETPLISASWFERADIVRHLISHGVDLNAESGNGTALHGASENGRLEIARVLLEHGANPNALDHQGRTALHLAEELTVVKVLLKYGVDVDVRDKQGWTPLHKAAYELNLQIVVILLDHGADPHAQTNKGETPFQLANAPDSWASKENQSQIKQAQIKQSLSEHTGERI